MMNLFTTEDTIPTLAVQAEMGLIRNVRFLQAHDSSLLSHMPEYAPSQLGLVGVSVHSSRDSLKSLFQRNHPLKRHLISHDLTYELPQMRPAVHQSSWSDTIMLTLQRVINIQLKYVIFIQAHLSQICKECIWFLLKYVGHFWAPAPANICTECLWYSQYISLYTSQSRWNTFCLPLENMFYK